MKNGLRFVWEEGTAQIEEKKSKFITTVRPVHSEEEALEMIAGLKKKYWDATHNCWAYCVGDRQQLQRCSDDGEPQGTAGRPMLEVILKQDVHDVCVVVTRYFGGTLLGAGGLVRAYSAATAAGLGAARILEKCKGKILTVRSDYSDSGKIQYILAQDQVPVLDTRYTDCVETDLAVDEETEGLMKKKITEATAGRAIWTEETEMEFALDGREVILL
ncbi:MAG: YigZ family protein [Lachnospiraceae bacterium]|nr:YigZ family protein [Lachnospiraceae bacterium]